MGAPFGKVAAAPFGKMGAPFGKFGAFPFAAGFGKAAVVAAPVDKKVPFGKFDTFPVGKVAPVGKVVAVEKALVAAPVAAKKVVAPAGAFNVFPNGPFVGGSKAAGVVVPGKKLASAGFAGFF